eukprot:scaffold654181_cov97-Prasinocladus_malaysianus.AAC.1
MAWVDCQSDCLSFHWPPSFLHCLPCHLDKAPRLGCDRQPDWKSLSKHVASCASYAACPCQL